MTLLDYRNTATTKKLDFKNSHLTSVGANDNATSTSFKPKLKMDLKNILRPENRI
jgi:hypothetical protein